MSYQKIRIVAPNTKEYIGDAQAFQFSGSALSATVTTEGMRYNSSGVATIYTSSTAAFTPGAPTTIIPVAATQFTSSNTTTSIIVYS
jgi:hypothetical protein